MDACVSPGMVARTIHEGGSSDVLNEIHSPGCAAAIWQRRLAPELQERLDAIEPQFLPEARIELEADRVAEALDVVFGGCGLTRSDALRTMLTADVVGIARACSQGSWERRLCVFGLTWSTTTPAPSFTRITFRSACCAPTAAAVPNMGCADRPKSLRPSTRWQGAQSPCFVDSCGLRPRR